MNEVTDFLGRIIEIDDVLVYPVRKGSKMWLSRFTVSKIESDAIHGTNPAGRRVKLTNLANCVVVRPRSMTPEITAAWTRG